MKARQTRRVFGALTLGIVKVRRNGDNYTIQLACRLQLPAPPVL
ncbi:hypothetical protein ECZU29_33520 [Escherichia coli]|nr:hypothetical protein ECZU29_33520 [Escherichia coli]